VEGAIVIRTKNKRTLAEKKRDQLLGEVYFRALKEGVQKKNRRSTRPEGKDQQEVWGLKIGS